MESSKKARVLLPKPNDGDDSSLGTDKPMSLKRKRDKALAACEGCRRRKVRCDSKRPTCSQCISSSIECRYPVPEGMTPRESQKQQVEKASSLRTVLEMLRLGSEAESSSILRSIREASTLDDAVDTIAEANLLLPMRTSASNSPPKHTSVLDASPFDVKVLSSSLTNDLSRRTSDSSSIPPGVLPLAQWTSVTQDDKYLTHLLNLFWTWDHTLCRVVDRTVFLDDLTCDPNDEVRFCSRFMINALMAVSSIYYRQDKPSDTAPDDGRAFADEALHLLETERNYQSITLVQGLALLWVYEGNCGNQSRSAELLNDMYRVHKSLGLSTIIMPTGTRMSDPTTRRKWHAISSICWGFYSLSVKLSLALVETTRVSKPRIPKMFEDEENFLAYTDMTIHLWSPYPQSSLPRCSLSQEAFRAECQLAEMVEPVLSFVVFRPDFSPDYDKALKLYHKLVGWKVSLPDNLQAISNVLPSVIFLHATFDMAVLKLLRPFSQGVPWMFGTETTGSMLRLTHAMTMMSNLGVYRATFGLRHEYWIMQACYTAAESVIAGLDTSTASTDVFTRACRLLYDIGGYLPLANEFLIALKATLLREQIPTPSSINKIFSGVSSRAGPRFITGVRLALPLYDSTGLEVTSSLKLPQDVKFSDKIHDIQ